MKALSSYIIQTGLKLYNRKQSEAIWFKPIKTKAFDKSEAVRFKATWNLIVINDQKPFFFKLAWILRT